MGRAPCCEKMGLKKGPWTHEEDSILISYIQKHGHSNWRALPKQAGLLRCGKSCRLRWTNYLRPDIKRGNFTKEEEDTIISLHQKLGNRWSAIATRLPGRTDNEIKNVWHTHLKKRLERQIQLANTDIQELLVPPNTPPKSYCNDIVSATSSTTTTTTLETSSFDEHSSLSLRTTITASDNDHHDHEVQVKSEPVSIDLTEYINSFLGADECMYFWYNLFVEAEGLPELPEF